MKCTCAVMWSLHQNDQGNDCGKITKEKDLEHIALCMRILMVGTGEPAFRSCNRRILDILGTEKKLRLIMAKVQKCLFTLVTLATLSVT